VEPIGSAGFEPVLAARSEGSAASSLAQRSKAFRAVFEALREIDTAAFIREDRVYGGGLYKMEPKELGRLNAEPVVAAMGG
jgi:adenine-specific DNA-methyltransferase